MKIILIATLPIAFILTAIKVLLTKAPLAYSYSFLREVRFNLPDAYYNMLED